MSIDIKTLMQENLNVTESNSEPDNEKLARKYEAASDMIVEACKTIDNIIKELKQYPKYTEIMKLLKKYNNELINTNEKIAHIDLINMENTY